MYGSIHSLFLWMLQTALISHPLQSVDLQSIMSADQLIKKIVDKLKGVIYWTKGTKKGKIQAPDLEL